MLGPSYKSRSVGTGYGGAELFHGIQDQPLALVAIVPEADRGANRMSESLGAGALLAARH